MMYSGSINEHQQKRGNIMAGYDFESGMSNNAVTAYDRGLLPLSKIKASDLKEAGVKMTKAFATWLAQNYHWDAAEWHHSSSHFNKVNFYDVEELARLINDQEINIQELSEKFKAEVALKSKGQRVKGQFKVWGGTRNRPVLRGEQKFTGTLIGNWIHLDGGGKKKANGNHIVWR